MKVACSICYQEFSKDKYLVRRKRKHEKHHTYQGGSKNVSRGKVSWLEV